MTVEWTGIRVRAAHTVEGVNISYTAGVLTDAFE